MLNLVLLGRSGSGKGTQAELILKQYPDLVYIEMGDLFRALAQQETDIGFRVKQIIASGGLPPEEIPLMLWSTEIAYKVKENQGFLLDGSPRRLEEAVHLGHLLDFMERSISVLLIDISKEEAFNRLSKRRICTKCGFLVPYVDEYKDWMACKKCGGELVTRADDTSEGIQTRLNWFDSSVGPVIDFYEKQNMLVRVNGEQSIGNVFQDIVKYLKSQKGV